MVLPKAPPSLFYQEPSPANPSLSLRFLGTAGFVIQGEGHTLVLDPFVTRPGIWDTLFRPLTPNEELIKSLIPSADDVLVGHAHFDHILDAPSVCHQTGARLIGSPSVCQVGRAAGLPESQLLSTQGRETITSGPATIVGLPSIHGKVYFGHVPLQGNIERPPSWPPRYRELLCGLVLNWWLELAGHRIVHIDSADFIDDELKEQQADILCLCAIGRHQRPNYVKTAVELLRPKYILPCHWDWFFSPFHAPARMLPGVDLKGFLREINDAGATPILLPFNGTFSL
jgi:L-ascorbate metabolism protein UlaG (beta-lactamase superfamily)